MSKSAFPLGLAAIAVLAGSLTLIGQLPQAPGVDGPIPAADWTVDTASDQPACAPLRIEGHVSDDQVVALIAAGWWADPADGMEALYSPSCPRPAEHTAQPAATPAQPAPVDYTTLPDEQRFAAGDAGLIHCPDGQSLTEDYTCVPRSFYNH